MEELIRYGFTNFIPNFAIVRLNGQGKEPKYDIELFYYDGKKSGTYTSKISYGKESIKEIISRNIDFLNRNGYKIHFHG